MKKARVSLAVAVVLCLFDPFSSLGQQTSSSTGHASPTVTAQAAPSWPRVFDRDGVHVVVYQPQLRSWQKYRTLVADTAISITDPGQKAVLGVVSWRAETIANVSAQTVYISNIQYWTRDFLRSTRRMRRRCSSASISSTQP